MLIVLYVIGGVCFLVGAKGFTEEGLAFSATTRLKGKTGRTVGDICFAVGAAIIAVCIWITVRISS